MKPLIVTLQFDAATAAFFEAGRRAHFPPELNFIPAHLTLFHNLPGAEETRVIETLARAAAARAPFAVTVSGLMRLGRGVAYRIEAPPLLALRAELAAAFDDVLVRQDRQGFRPHVTIQNKTSPERAGALFEHLAADFSPFEGLAEGLQLWAYEGGPWRAKGAIGFAPA